jgi:hypothetical protein
MKSNKFVLVLFFVFLVFSLQVVSAAGAGTYYSKNNPLKMYPGQEKEIILYLQNAKGDTDLIFETNLVDGSEIAEIVSGNVYEVPFGTVDKNVVLNINVPEDSGVGQEYKLVVEFRQISAGVSEGMVGIVTGFDALIPVKVVSQGDETPESTQPTVSEEEEGMAVWLWVLFAVLALIALIHYLTKKKNESLK